MLVLLEWSAAFITWFLVRTQPYWRRVEPFVRLVLLVVVSLIVTFWVSVFFYLAVYNFYVPAVEGVMPLHFKFDSDCKLGDSRPGIACSFPTENVTFSHHLHQPFALGQMYKVFLELQMPESQVNRDIGMFMISISFYGRFAQEIQASSRAAMLEYRSPLLTTLDTLVFSPLYLLGSKQQRQTIRVEMFDDFHDNPYNKALGCLVRLESPLLQLYSARLQIYAKFSGIRWFMFYQPMLAAFLGVTVVFLLLNFLILISLVRRQWVKMEQSGEVNVSYSGDDDWLNDEELETEEEKSRKKKKKQREEKASRASSGFVGVVEDDDDDDHSWPEPRPVVDEPDSIGKVTTLGVRQRVPAGDQTSPTSSSTAK